MTRTTIEGWHPLSEAQRSRWLLKQAGLEGGLNNNGCAARVHGDLDAGKLSEALARLAARHPMLRAQFREVDGEPQQRITTATAIPVTTLDASALDEAALMARVAKDWTSRAVRDGLREIGSGPGPVDVIGLLGSRHAL